jgi:ABC-type antimicrobial peptide transport system permease subunit
MEDLIADRTAPRRLNMQLFAVFAALALFMAAVGLYGVIAFMVEQRTHEIGIRVAMGADKWAVLRLVLGQGMKLTASGMAAGVGAALVLTRLLTSFLFGVTSSDPLTFAAVAVLLAAVAFAACCLPAWRAAAVDPIAALRCE